MPRVLAVHPAPLAGSLLALAVLVACRPTASEPPGPPSTAATVSPTSPAPPAPPPSTPPAATPTQKTFLAGVDTPPGGTWQLDREGSLNKDDIRTVVRAGIGAIRTCYNAGLARDPSLKGRVTVQFVIAADGAVAKSVVQDSSLPNSARSVADCIAAAAMTWPFPAPEGGGRVIVSYPFVLEPSDNIRSPSGLSSVEQGVGEWFVVSGFSSRALVVEIADHEGHGATGVKVTLRVNTREREEQRSAVTDTQGRAVFDDLPTAGSATALLDGSAASTSVPLGQGARATILRAPSAAVK